MSDAQRSVAGVGFKAAWLSLYQEVCELRALRTHAVIGRWVNQKGVSRRFR
jgi:hypothetical protein